MRRRTMAAATAVVGIALGVGAATTLAAGTHHSRRGMHKHSEPAEWGKKWVSKPVTVALNCNVFMTVVPPGGSDTVSPPEAHGVMYGPTYCPGGVYSENSTFGPGVISSPFQTAPSGDTISHYTDYFPGGSLWGHLDLTPQGGTFGHFSSNTWKGTVTVSGGTGLYRFAKTARPGTESCSSPDSVHLKCTEQVTVKMFQRVRVKVRLK